VTTTPIADADAAAQVASVLEAWSRSWFDSGALVALEGSVPTDRHEPARWLLRFRGEEKEFVTIWLTVRQRTVHVEAQLSPAPEGRVEDVYRYLLKKNADRYPLTLALGPEDAIYLVSRVPVGELTASRLDELCGAALHDVDEIFPTVMTMGLPALYRRRHR
jgi:hypothetical protein